MANMMIPRISRNWFRINDGSMLLKASNLPLQSLAILLMGSNLTSQSLCQDQTRRAALNIHGALVVPSVRKFVALIQGATAGFLVLGLIGELPAQDTRGDEGCWCHLRMCNRFRSGVIPAKAGMTAISTSPNDTTTPSFDLVSGNRQSTLRQAHGSTVLTVPEVAAATRREGRERS